MKQKLTIYYIATNQYVSGFDLFQKNISKFMPQFEKEVRILSNELREWHKKEIDGVKYNVYYLNHQYCWPIIALFKMTHILYSFDETADFICYFNADASYNTEFNNWDLFDYDKLNLTYHAGINNNMQCTNAKYFINLSNDNPLSKSYIGHLNYDYIQSGFFFGKANIVKQMCIDINNYIEMDLRKQIIPKWHDESYLNKWALEHKELCTKNVLMTLQRSLTKDVPIYITPKIIKKPCKK